MKLITELSQYDKEALKHLLSSRTWML